MKNFKIIFLYIFYFTFFSTLLNAQNLQVHNMIGKKQSEVIKKYGNPVHKDASNPSMLCMFYQTKISTMIFVSNAEGVYQAEATKIFDLESNARTEIDLFISDSRNNGFDVDSVTTSDFHLHKKGTKVDLQINENKLSKKFDIRIKASKVED